MSAVSGQRVANQNRSYRRCGVMIASSHTRANRVQDVKSIYPSQNQSYPGKNVHLAGLKLGHQNHRILQHHGVITSSFTLKLLT